MIFRVIGVFGTGYTGNYQNSYDMYCRNIHYAKLHHIGTKDCSMDCIKPDGSSSVLFSMVSDELKEYDPCKDCKYVDRCSEQGNPYKYLHE